MLIIAFIIRSHLLRRYRFFFNRKSKKVFKNSEYESRKSEFRSQESAFMPFPSASVPFLVIVSDLVVLILIIFKL